MSQSQSHDKYGKIVHRPCSSCISSVQELNKDSIKFSLSTWSMVKSSQPKSLHSGHRILLLLFSDTPATMSFCSHQVHFILTAPFSFPEHTLHLYASRHWLHQMFFNCFSEQNPVPSD